MSSKAKQFVIWLFIVVAAVLLYQLAYRPKNGNETPPGQSDSVQQPNDYSGKTSEPPGSSIHTPGPAQGARSQPVTGPRQEPFAVHISAPKQGPRGWRFAVLGVLACLPVLIVAMMRRSVLKRTEIDPRAGPLVHARFVNLMTLGLVLYWWSAFSLLKLHPGPDYELAFTFAASRMLIEGAAAVLAPALIFLCCVVLWAPVRARVRLPAGTWGDYSRAPYRLFTLFLTIHLSFGMFFYFYEADFFTGFACICGVIVLSAVAKRLTWLKPPGSDKYILLNAELRGRIFELAVRAGARLQEVFVLPETGNNLVNAFATKTNCICISEGLLRKLGRQEVDAIVAHELGHVKRGHPAKRSQAMGAPLALGMFAQWFLGPMGKGVLDASVFFPICLVSGLLLSLFLSRRFEYAADRYAVQATGDPERAITGLLRIGKESRLPDDWSKWDEKAFTHPSILRRVKRIASASGIGREDLEQLMQLLVEPADHYSLAAGAPETRATSDGQPTRAGFPGGRRKKTWYCLSPVKFAFLVSFAGTLLFAACLNIWPELLNDSLILLNLPLGGAVILAGVVAGVWRMRSLKKRLSSALTESWNLAPAAHGFPAAFDTDAIQTLSADLERVGFAIERDYVGRRESDGLQCAERLLANRRDNCYATLAQKATGTLGITHVVCTVNSDLQDGTHFYTTNAEPVATAYACRLPNEIATSRPWASPADLFKYHLERRGWLSADGGLEPIPPPDGSAYVLARQDQSRSRAERVRRRLSIVFLLELDLFSRRPKSEWGRGTQKRTRKPEPVPQVAD